MDSLREVCFQNALAWDEAPSGKPQGHGRAIYNLPGSTLQDFARANLVVWSQPEP
jgi:hypothetical protein